jgi:DNA-directed RNA polymerase specialized sigma24 family protein
MHMGVKFETTNWSLIVRARGSTTEGRRTALAGLCDAYWYPLYSFARRRGCDHEDASDLTQAFFLHLIEKHAFEGLTPAQGRLRAFLLASFKHFQSDERQRTRARKRGGDLIRIPWDDDVKVGYAGTANAGEDGTSRRCHRARGRRREFRAISARNHEGQNARYREKVSPCRDIHCRARPSWEGSQEGRLIGSLAGDHITGSVNVVGATDPRREVKPTSRSAGVRDTDQKPSGDHNQPEAEGQRWNRSTASTFLFQRSVSSRLRCRMWWSQTFASWNQIGDWMRRLEAL